MTVVPTRDLPLWSSQEFSMIHSTLHILTFKISSNCSKYEGVKDTYTSLAIAVCLSTVSVRLCLKRCNRAEKANYASVGIAAPYFIANIHQAVSWKPLKFVASIFSEAVKSYWNFRAVI
jgi:hypothetical protein